MEEQIISILKESINNIFFLPVLGISIILVIIKSKVDYRKYKRDCEIFNQMPKPIGYIQNSVINIIGIMTLTVIGFAGYTGLTHSNQFEEKYINNIAKEERKSSNYENATKITNIENNIKPTHIITNKTIPFKHIKPKESNKKLSIDELIKENERLKQENNALKNYMSKPKRAPNNITLRENGKIVKTNVVTINTERIKLKKENERLKKDIKILIDKNDELTAMLEVN